MPNVRERLYEKVNESGECWVFEGASNAAGYGYIGCNGKNEYVHRVSFELENGPIPDGKIIMHTCDNPSCVRPSHLKLGTQKENRLDAVRKGRTAKGVRVNTAKLTPDDVLEIRKRSAQGESFRALGREYGVTHTAISHLVKRKTWKHVP